MKKNPSIKIISAIAILGVSASFHHEIQCHEDKSNKNDLNKSSNIDPEYIKKINIFNKMIENSKNTPSVLKMIHPTVIG